MMINESEKAGVEAKKKGDEGYAEGRKDENGKVPHNYVNIGDSFETLALEKNLQLI